jgi:rhamnogalacturonan acetylesterase
LRFLDFALTKPAMQLTHTMGAIALAAISTTLAAPTIFLAGDSTMTAKGNNDGTAGWGAFLNNYTTLAIENDAIAGRSARSFTREGRFTTMAASVKARHAPDQAIA